MKTMISAITLSSVLFAGSAYATGLGKLTVMSSRGQPLRAEIELTSPDRAEIAKLVASIASPDTFRQADVEYKPVLQNLRFAVESRSNGYVLKISSIEQINDPYLDFFVELTTPNGKLLREYTFFLDESVPVQAPQLSSVGRPAPVVTQAPEVVENVSAKPLSAPSTAKGKSASDVVSEKTQKVEKTKSAKRNQKADKKVAKSNEEPNEKKPATAPKESTPYQVKSGDTLIGIARNATDGAPLDQMMLSIYLANEQSFVDQNMNRLKAGVTLNIPSSESVRANPVKDASAVIQVHLSNFHSYRTKLAESVVTGKARKTDNAKQQAAGTITTKVHEKDDATASAIDKLKLSKVKADAAKKQATDEDAIAKKRALEDANARLKELEKNINDLNAIAKEQPVSAASMPSAASAASAASTSPLPAKIPVATATPIALAKKPPAPPVQRTWIDDLKDWIDVKFLIGMGVSALVGGLAFLVIRTKKKQEPSFVAEIEQESNELL